MNYFSKIKLFILSFVALPLLAQDSTGAEGTIRTGAEAVERTGAEGSIQPKSGDFKIENPLKGGADSILDLIAFIVNDIILPIGVTIAALAIIYSGFLFVTSQGNETKLEKAKQTFMYTVIGAAILLGAWTIVGAITGTICEIANVPGLCNTQIQQGAFGN